MTLIGRINAIVEPVVTALGVELVDLEHTGGTVRVVVDEDGGIGTERLGEVTVAVSRVLDEHDPVPGRYTLEVSSPGVERPLRTPRHFERARGLKVSLRARADDGSFRRLVGVIVGSDDEAVSLRAEPERAGDEHTLERVPYGAIDRARTIFEWGPAPKPGKGSKPGSAKKRTGAGTASTDAGRGQADTGQPQVATSPGTPGTRPGGNR